MKITILGREIEIRYTLRALFIFEQITGKIFALNTVTDQYILMYSLILANDSTLPMTFDDFIAECDKSPELIRQLQEFITKEMEKQACFDKNEPKTAKKKS